MYSLRASKYTTIKRGGGLCISWVRGSVYKNMLLWKKRGKNLHRKKGNRRTQATFRNIILSFPAHEANSFSQNTHSSRPPPEGGVRVASTTFLSKTFICVGKILIKKFPLSLPSSNMENSWFSTKNLSASELRFMEDTLSWKLLFWI